MLLILDRRDDLADCRIKPTGNLATGTSSASQHAHDEVNILLQIDLTTLDTELRILVARHGTEADVSIVGAFEALLRGLVKFGCHGIDVRLFAELAASEFL